MKKTRIALYICLWLFLASAVSAEEPYLLTAADAGVRAVRYDTALQSAYADISLQYKALGLDLRNFFPLLAFDFGSNDTTRVQEADSRLMSVSATLTQLLWDGGKAIAGYTKKKMELEQSLRRLDRQSREVREKAVALFYSVLVSEKKIKLKEKVLALADEQLNVIKREVSLGVTTEMEFRKAEGTYRTLLVEKKALEISAKLERLELAKLIHIDNNFILDSSAAEVFPLPKLSVEYLYNRALRASAELDDITWRMKNLQTDLSIKRWSMIPSVSLVAVFSTSTDELPFSEYTWSVGLQLGFSGGLLSMNTGLRYGKTSSNDTQFVEQSGSGVPLQDFSGFLRPSYYDNALKQAAMEAENLRRAIRLNVEASLERYKLALEQKNLSEEMVALMNEQYELVLAQKQLGLVKQIDVMNAALAVEEKYLDCIDSDYAVLKAEREIEQLVMLPPGQLGRLFCGE